MQVWPELRYLQVSAPAMAASRSASSKTMNGALPPSSSETFLICPAHWAMSSLPTSVEPVKDRKSTRLNSSHPSISYAVFCLKKKKKKKTCMRYRYRVVDDAHAGDGSSVYIRVP